MSGKGVIRRELVTHLGSTQVIEALSSTYFNKNDAEIYKKIFNQLWQKGIIASGEFENPVWSVYHKGKKITRFTFDLDM